MFAALAAKYGPEPAAVTPQQHAPTIIHPPQDSVPLGNGGAM